jgi:hypothetical protein
LVIGVHSSYIMLMTENFSWWILLGFRDYNWLINALMFLTVYLQMETGVHGAPGAIAVLLVVVGPRLGAAFATTQVRHFLPVRLFPLFWFAPWSLGIFILARHFFE